MYPVLGFTETHYLLLNAYRVKRSYAQAHKAIYDCLGREINLGRKIPRCSQELVDWGLIQRANPGSSCRQGYKHKITAKGEKAIKEYQKAINSIASPNTQPEFGF